MVLQEKHLSFRPFSQGNEYLPRYDTHRLCPGRLRRIHPILRNKSFGILFPERCSLRSLVWHIYVIDRAFLYPYRSFDIHKKIYPMCDNKFHLPADQHSYTHKMCRTYGLEYRIGDLNRCRYNLHDSEFEDSSRPCTYGKQENPCRQNSVDTSS